MPQVTPIRKETCWYVKQNSVTSVRRSETPESQTRNHVQYRSDDPISSIVFASWIYKYPANIQYGFVLFTKEYMLHLCRHSNTLEFIIHSVQ